MTDAPILPLTRLDTLWVQVTGTLCNLACLHCFISCGPKNKQHTFMSLGDVETLLDDSLEYGVKEIYFTGGEPFLHPDIKPMILAALEVAPLTILTNGTLVDSALASWLGRTFRTSRTSLDIRVSLDGLNPEQNDPIRGRGSFVKIVDGIQQLAAHGINPVITITECLDDISSPDARLAFQAMLAEFGIYKPRLKFLPPFKLGREERRDRAYSDSERLCSDGVNPEAIQHLQCATCRMVTSNGVFPCPILINDTESRMGKTLRDGTTPISLDRPACYTCYWEGVSCRT